MRASAHVLILFSVACLAASYDADMSPATNGTTTTARPFYGDFFHYLFLKFAPIHGYASIFICFFGIIVNIITITVLTRKVIFNAAVVILIAIATVDIFIMTEYIPHSLVTYVINLQVPPRQSIKFADKWVA